MVMKFANNASTTLSAGINASTTSLVVASGGGALFPAPTGGDFFYCTIQSGAAIEIVKVTGRSTDTFTIVRGQDGTTGQSWSSGATIELRLNAGTMAIYNRFVSVEDFGAIPDDVTKAAINTTAINAAMTWGGANNIPIHLLGGVYYVDGAINIPLQGSLLGTAGGAIDAYGGVNSSKISYYGGAAAIAVVNTAPHWTGRLENFAIDGNEAADTCLTLACPIGSYFANLDITKSNYQGVLWTSDATAASGFNTWVNCRVTAHVRDAVSISGYFRATAPYDEISAVTLNDFYNCRFQAQNGHASLRIIGGADTNHFVGGRIEGNPGGYAIVLGEMTNNAWDTSGTNYTISGGSGVNSFIGVSIGEGGGTGITSLLTDWPNYFIRCGIYATYPYNLNSGAGKITITDCTITDGTGAVATQQAFTVAVTGTTPFVYDPTNSGQAIGRQQVFITGGSGVTVTLYRPYGAVNSGGFASQVYNSTSLGTASGGIILSIMDKLSIAYSSAPTITVVPF